jgi:DUF4097 and DUF4098 domain-containing protein YvlB
MPRAALVRAATPTMPSFHRPMPRSLALLLALGALAALPRDGAAQRDDDAPRARLDTTFAFGQRGSAELTLQSGEIIVHAWSEPRVRIRATSERGDLRFDASGSTFFSLGVRNGRSGDTRFEVTVPVGTRVRATTQSGDVSIVGTKGEIEAHAMNGDVRVEDAADRVEVGVISGDVTVRRATGDLRLAAVSGDIAVEEASGEVEAETVSGDVTLRGVTSRRVRAKSTSGDVDFDGPIDPAGRYELGSHSGEVALAIPASTSAQITVSTFSGTIDSDFPITLRPGEHAVGMTQTRRFTFDVGRGEARISAESFSGNVTITQRDARRPSR